MSLTDDIESYIAEMKRTGQSEKTIKNWNSTLKRFALWARENRRSLDDNSVRKFLDQFERPSTRNAYLVRLEGLARHTETVLKVKAVQTETRDIEALDSGEIARLVQSACTISPSLGATIIFLSETGLRYGEFLAFSQDNVQTKGDSSFIRVIGKGRKHRIVPLSKNALGAIPHLPVNMTAWQAQCLAADMATAGRIANLPMHVHPHLLRASFVSIMLNEKKADSVILCKITGHASPSTLANCYYLPSVDRLCEAVA
jgi:site-specific recombinase XerD